MNTETLATTLRTPAQQLAAMRLSKMVRERAFVSDGKIPPERELAAILGISRGTLRQVLKNLQAHGLVSITPNRRGRAISVQAASQQRAVGYLSLGSVEGEGSARHTKTGWSSFIDLGVSEVLRAHGFHLLNLNRERVDEDTFEWLERTAVAGLIVEGGERLSVGVRGRVLGLAERGVPVVCDVDEPWAAGLDRVVSDHVAGCEALTRWLVGQGRRRVVRFWTSPESYWWRQMRDRGYERALAGAGLAVLPVIDAGVQLGTVSAPYDEAGFQLWSRVVAGWLAPAFLSGGQPDAILVESDHQAYPVNAALRMLGRRPGVDVLVAGYDDYGDELACAAWEPLGPAATVNKDNVRIGQQLAEVLTRRLASQLPPQPQRVTIAPRLVVAGAAA